MGIEPRYAAVKAEAFYHQANQVVKQSFIFDAYGSHIDLCSESRSSSRLAKNFNVGHYMQTFQPNLFMPAMHIGTITQGWEFPGFRQNSGFLMVPEVILEVCLNLWRRFMCICTL